MPIHTQATQNLLKIKDQIMVAQTQSIPPEPNLRDHPDEYDVVTTLLSQNQWLRHQVCTQEFHNYYEIGECLALSEYNHADARIYCGIGYQDQSIAQKIYHVFFQHPDIKNNLQEVPACWFLAFTWRQCNELAEWLNICISPTQVVFDDLLNLEVPDIEGFHPGEEWVNTENWDYLLN